jgi:hypothetical protein
VTTNKGDTKMALVEFKTVAGQLIAINAGAVATVEEIGSDESFVELLSGTRYRIESGYEAICRDVSDAGVMVNGPA